MLSQAEFNRALRAENTTALAPFRAKRAIFLAAGFGSRLHPITINTPKPLVRVNGVRMIDKSIDACLALGIEEIYVIRGYLKEQFDQLLYKYPMIRFINNEKYHDMNNISSAIAARNYRDDIFCNAYVLEADLVLSNPSLLRKYHYTSEVLGRYVERSNDWCLTVDLNGFVKSEKPIGFNCYQMMGIYYFTSEDGKKLSRHLVEVQQLPHWQDRYWETVPNQCYQGQYKIKVMPYSQNDIIEIDTFTELQAVDSSYIIH